MNRENEFHLIAQSRFKNQYDQPWRVYHAWSHIRYGIDILEKYFDVTAQSSAGRRTLTAWYMHDLVYVPRSPSNETASADLVSFYTGLTGISPRDSEIIRAIIKATKNHEFSELDVNEENREVYVKEVAKIIDTDLSGFALLWPNSAWEVYQEFKSVLANPDEDFDSQWCKGQIGFLNSLLDKDTIFKTEIGQNLWEQKARNNIQKEIDGLRDGIIARP